MVRSVEQKKLMKSPEKCYTTNTEYGNEWRHDGLILKLKLSCNISHNNM